MNSDLMSKAKAKIEQERDRRTGLLNLGGLALSQIPGDVLELEWLREIIICQTEISDLSPLRKLTALEAIDCANTPVIDLQPIVSLQRLRKLECSNTRVISLGPLQFLKELQTLYFWQTKVEDLKPLFILDSLQDLDCSATNVTSLAPIRGKKDLRRLNISRNEISSLSELGCLEKLESLLCNKTVIRDLPAEASFPRVYELEMSETAFLDLKMVARLSTLERLNCAETRITDLSPLTSLARLRELNCSGCRLQSLPTEVWDYPGFKLFTWKTDIPGVPSKILSTHRYEDCSQRLRDWTRKPLRNSKRRTGSGSLRASAKREVNPSSTHETYHNIFLSHTGRDKPFVRRLRDDLLAQGVTRVWVDEAEIEIGDSLIAKIEEGINFCRYIGVVLSTNSIKAPWVRKELDVAMNREISDGQVVVLPILYEKCEMPEFLKGKLYADFTNPDTYQEALDKILRRLRIR